MSGPDRPAPANPHRGEAVGQAVIAAGLAACTAPLRALLGQVLKGSP